MRYWFYKRDYPENIDLQEETRNKRKTFPL